MTTRNTLASALLAALATTSLLDAQPRAPRKDVRPAARWRAAIPSSELKSGSSFGYLYDVEFLSRHVGWAVGGHSDKTMLYHTTDGGRSWERVPLLDGGAASDLKAIGFADANNGWIVGRYHILRTRDGGETWDPVDGGDGLWATSLLVLGPDAIVIGKGDSKFRFTTDGGRSWRDAQIPELTSGFQVAALGFVPPDRLFAVLNNNGYSSGRIYVSTDGGNEWEEVATSDKALHALDFFDERRGVAVGDGVAFVTDDGGESWRRVIVAGTRYGVDYIDENTIVSVGRLPASAISRNGGRTWTPLAGPETGGSLVDVHAVDGGWWFAAGGYGSSALFHYSDPAYRDVVGEATIPIPGTIRLPGGKTLPAGMYDVELVHRDTGHVLALERTGEAPDTAAAAADDSAAIEPASGGEDAPAAPACDPCTAEVPIEVEYDKVDVSDRGGGARQRVRVSLEPTATGVAIVLDAPIRPPREIGRTLEFLRVEHEVESTVSVRDAGEARKKAGGFLGRVRKAAEGDVRGAIGDAPINPKKATEKIRAAKASPPAVYRVKLRYPVELFRPKSAPAEKP